MPTLSILISAYNEAAYLHRCLENIVNEKIEGWEKEIIVVNDGSTDKTAEILAEFRQSDFPIKIINQISNQGKGAAIKKAAAAATGNVLLIQDADLEYDPHDYNAILEKYSHKNVFVVFGSRILGEKFYTNKTSSQIFYWGGRSLSLLMNVLFGIHITDQPTCYKSWKAELTEELLLNCPSNRFEFEIEMTAFFAKKKLAIAEVPIHYYPRTVGLGKKIGFKDFLASVTIAFRCFLKKDLLTLSQSISAS